MRVRPLNLYWMALLSLACVSGLAAKDMTGSARVNAILGRAYVSEDGESFKVLKPGAIINQGDTLVTQRRSAIDLILGKDAGTVRLMQNSRVQIKTLLIQEDFNVGKIELDLLRGNLLGLDVGLSRDAVFEVLIPIGTVRCQSAHFRVDARGYLVNVRGKMNFKPSDSESTLGEANMEGPPVSYYAPKTGVRQAPSRLIQEMEKQSRPDLLGKQSGSFSWFPSKPKSQTKPKPKPKPEPKPKVEEAKESTVKEPAQKPKGTIQFTNPIEPPKRKF